MTTLHKELVAQHHLVIIPGLGDDTKFLQFVTRNWQKKYGIIPHVISFGWKGKTALFTARLENLYDIVQSLLQKGHTVSLLGTSAGGSAAINIYSKFPEISYVINVCGRLRKGIDVYPSLEQATKHHPIFTESILACENTIDRLISTDKDKILMRPLYDEIVPVSTMTIAGVTNKRIIAVEHVASMFIAMTLYAKSISSFINPCTASGTW